MTEPTDLTEVAGGSNSADPSGSCSPDEPDWQSIRIRAAIAVLAARSTFARQNDRHYHDSTTAVAKADALVVVLKGTRQ